jgi:hypothetical protein
MLRSPKERFLSSTLSGAWGKVVQMEAYEEAIHAALGQLCADSPKECPVPQAACDAHQQLIGARKVLDILSTLHVPEKPTTTTQPGTLNYEAGV